MTERPVLVPTSFGPAGAIVGEPAGTARGGALVLQGLASPRAGFGRMWAVTARALVEQGLMVLRVDYPGLGDSSLARGGTDAHRPFLGEMLAWFRKESGVRGIGAVASCYGARVAIGLAADGALDSGLLLVTPWLGVRRGRGRVRELARRARRRAGLPSPLDRAAVTDLRTAAAAVPVRVLVGERDTQERTTLRAAARRLSAPIPVEVQPGVRLHPAPGPSTRSAVTAWVVSRCDLLLPAEIVPV